MANRLHSSSSPGIVPVYYPVCPPPTTVSLCPCRCICNARTGTRESNHEIDSAQPRRQSGRVLEWDEEAGSLSGALADEVLSLIGMVVDTGFVSVQPGPFRISVKDPLRDRREMAAVFADSFFSLALQG